MRNWALSKKEISINLGITQYNGDLGGVNKWNSKFGTTNMKWPSTSWNASVGYHHRFHPYWTTTSRIQIGQLKGSDGLHDDTYREARNLHFKTPFIELSQRIDLLILVNEKFNGHYRLKKNNPFYQIYAFAGAGILCYNPKAKYESEWVNLHKLRTEGQGLPNGPKPYKRITATAPIGLGFSYHITRMWRIGFEAEYVFAFTDYLDDAGGVYYDKEILAQEIGETSAALSNPSISNSDWFVAGQARGDKGLDGYFNFSFFLRRNITYRIYKTKKGTEETTESQ